MKRNPFVIIALAGTVALLVLAVVNYAGSAGVATSVVVAQVPDEMGEGCKAKVDPDKCVGCGRCVSAAPEAFAWDETRRVATVKADASAAAIERGIKACPVDAISH